MFVMEVIHLWTFLHQIKIKIKKISQNGWGCSLNYLVEEFCDPHNYKIYLYNSRSNQMLWNSFPVICNLVIISAFYFFVDCYQYSYWHQIAIKTFGNQHTVCFVESPIVKKLKHPSGYKLKHDISADVNAKCNSLKKV